MKMDWMVRIGGCVVVMAACGCGVVGRDGDSNGTSNGNTNGDTNGVVIINGDTNGDTDLLGEQGDACESRDDCARGLYCDDGQCRAMCEHDEQCEGDLVCRQGIDTTVKLCQEIESTFILIEDVSTSDACGGGDPGSDLFAVALYDADDEQLAWGRTVWSDVGASNFDDVDVLDGRPPATAGGACPEFSAMNVVALGCGGQLVVDFLDTSGESIPIESGYSIEVFEFGSNCPTGSASDTYDTYFCRDDFDPQIGVLDSCTTPVITTGSGQEMGVVP